MNNVLLCALLIAGVSASFIQKAEASNKTYSERCDNYSSLSYASKDECLKDGRWHVIYETNAGGSVAYGSVDIVESHMTAGADFKIVAVNQRLFLNGSPLSINANLNEKCQQIYRSQLGARPIYCLSPLRFANELPGQTNHGSARYGTDGRVLCNGLSNPGANGCNTDPIALKFLIKY